MAFYKEAKDKLVKRMLGKAAVPAGLADLHNYFRVYGSINFQGEHQEDGSLLMMSQDFRYGSIITLISPGEDVNEKVQDAILTAFEVPSSYTKEAGIRRLGEKEYAFA